jgi:2'-5' RNA ligase
MSARLFVALDLPPAAAEAVAALSKGLPTARWTNPAQLHLTLRFMAAVPEEEVAGLTERLASVRRPAFPLALHAVGVFPDGRARRPPRVLWAGLTPEPPLHDLKRAIDQAILQAIALSDEDRDFRPHLTLARFREAPGPALAPWLATHAGFRTAAWMADAFVLYRSTLGSQGAHHQPLRRYPLG